MNSTPDDAQPGFLVTLARVLARSRAGQFVVAMLIAFVSGGVAYLAWQHRDFAALILTLFVLDYGIRKAWKFLPIPVGTRQALARWKDLSNAMLFGFYLWVVSFWSGPSWPDWLHVAFGLLGAASAYITTILKRLGDLDRSSKSGNS